MYTESQRKIFGPINPGDGQPIYLDPLAVLRTLTEELGGDPNEAIAVYNGTAEGSTPVAQAKAEGELVRASRRALQLVDFDPYSGEGATDQDALDLLHNFLSYLEGNG